MNDRFKFRAYNTCTGEFVNNVTCVGDYAHMDGDDGTKFHFRAYNGVRAIIYAAQLQKDWVLMQCTGLKDKNGKLICEGDVVKVCDVSALGYVRERIGKVVYGYSFYPAFVIKTTFGDIKDFTEDIEVIGNVYETPELLESEGKQCKK